MSITPKQLIEFSQALNQLHEKVTFTALANIDTPQPSQPHTLAS
jgi:hypothetical protein